MKYKANYFLFLFVLFSIVSSASGREVAVNSTEGLKAYLKEAKAGDTIYVYDGDYKGGFSINASGTSTQPITIIAENTGKARFLDFIRLNGTHIVLSGFYFAEKGGLYVAGQNCRITRCTMNNIEHAKWLQLSSRSQQIEIDYCLFENKENNKRLTKNCQVLQVNTNGSNERHHIHHNHFRNIPKGISSGSYETIQLISSDNPADPKAYTRNIVEYNLFENCDGDSEIISVRSNGNILRYNTFRDSAGELVLRQGDDNHVEGNFFFGTKTKGIRLQGAGQVIVNNYFYNTRKAVSFMDGTQDKAYARVERAKVMHNTIVNCSLGMSIGLNDSKYPNQGGYEPKECLIANNIFKVSGQVLTFENGDKPEGWIWKNNIFSGRLGAQEIDGLTSADPMLTRTGKELFLPSTKTPAAKPHYAQDILGVKRILNSKLGAFELSGELNKNAPLTETNTGPAAKQMQQ